MGNYCTICGKQFEGNETVCKNCNTPRKNRPQENIGSSAPGTIPQSATNANPNKTVLLVVSIIAIIFILGIGSFMWTFFSIVNMIPVEEIEIKVNEEINREPIEEIEENEFTKGKVVIEKYPYESGYIRFSSIYQAYRIYLDNDGLVFNFGATMFDDGSRVHISGNILNPNYLSGTVFMTTKYYDKNYNQVGYCSDVIDLLGEGYSAIAVACHTAKEELAENATVYDIKYYKINISSLEID